MKPIPVAVVEPIVKKDKEEEFKLEEDEIVAIVEPVKVTVEQPIVSLKPEGTSLRKRKTSVQQDTTDAPPLILQQNTSEDFYSSNFLNEESQDD